MSLSITNVRQAGSIEWDTILKECDYATFFQSREWAEIWSIYTNRCMQPDPKMVLFSDGKKVLLPFSSQKSFKGLIKKYISSPAGTFGGWLSTDNIKIEHAVLLVKYIKKRIGNLQWRLNPYDELVFKVQIKNLKNDETHAIKLINGFDEWAKGHSSAARKARKACKAGVEIKGASSQEEWREYYEVYEESLKRWGDKASSSYPFELFNTIYNSRSPNMQLWLAFHDNKIVSGALCFYAKKHVVYWHGAALSQYFNIRPVNLLMYEIIKNAFEKNYEWYDFNPSGKHQGVKAFKISFGAEALDSPEVYTETNCTKLFTKVARVIQRVEL